jgi:hypothetical protein
MTYFEELQEKTGGKDRSVRWFRDKIKELGTPPQRQLIREGLIRTRPTLGKMHFFMYDPKYKNDRNVLPYYDRFPLVMPLWPDGGGALGESFVGINFHYVSIPMRLKLLNIISEYADSDKFDENTRIKLTWNRIKRNRLIRPTIKRYLVNHVKTPFRIINAEEMMVAVLLPVQEFRHAKDTQVYADSRKIQSQPIRM